LKISSNAAVLIVDDDYGMRESLSDILRYRGHRVEVACDGFEAINKVKVKPFDVVLMDIRMPGMDGVETLKAVRALRPEVAVMMMTAYTEELQVAKALGNGAYICLSKPLNLDQVIDIIEEIHTGKVSTNV